MSSIRNNIVLNGINTATSILFPVITFPYAARILLPDGIGAVNFLNGIIGYIVLLTSLGIPMYAVKEVAKYRDDKHKRDKTTIEILLLSVILSVIGYAMVWALAKFVPEIHYQSSLFYVLSLTIVFNTIGVNWFYQAIGDFKFITIRGIIIRAISAIALFVFVKKSSDLLAYGFIVVGATVGNNLLNFIHLRKYIKPTSIEMKKLKIIKHLKPTLQVFVLNLIISLYIQLNTIILGYLSGDAAVGYFTAGTKIPHIVLTLMSSLSVVLLPQCTSLIETRRMNEFKMVILKSLNLTIALSLPLTVGLITLATPIIFVFCGLNYTNSIPVLCLNAPIIIFISLTNVIGTQVLYPMNKINLITWSACGAAVVNIIINFILIPPYGATGAAIASLISELIVLLIQLILGKLYYPFTIRDLFISKYIWGALLMGVSIFISISCISSFILQLIIGIFIGIISYTGFLIFFKDPLINDILKQLIKKYTSVR